MRRTISNIVAVSKEFLFLHILKMQFIKTLLIASKNLIFNGENWIFKYRLIYKSINIYIRKKRFINFIIINYLFLNLCLATLIPVYIRIRIFSDIHTFIFHGRVVPFFINFV